MLRKPLYLVLFLLTIQVSIGCTTKVDGLMVSKAMTYDALVERQIIAAGVVNASGAIDIGDSNSLAQQMRNMVTEERKGLQVMDVSAVSSKLGQAKYKDLLKNYQKNAGLSQQQMTDLQKALGRATFIALARVDRNDLTKTSSETSGNEYKDEKGRKQYKPGEVVRTHRRTMGVTMHIYDLKNKELAFTGTVTKSEDNVSRYEKNLISGVVSIINASKGDGRDDGYPYPRAPSEASVMGPVFKGFAQNFPKKKKK
jgi:hypothetical protein